MSDVPQRRRLLDRLFDLERTKRRVHASLDALVQVPFRLYTRDPRYRGYLTPACYSPWNVDDAFRSVFERVEDFTLMDRYKAYGLWQLVAQVTPLEGALLEVGVWRGGSGALIASRAASCGIESPVFLCDTFQGVVKAGARDAHYRGGEHADTSEATVSKLLTDLGLVHAEVVPGVFPDESGADLAGECFRFCHVDVDTYDSASGILEWLWPRLSPGGVVVYDDYGFPRCDGIREHVNEQMDLPDRLVIHNLTGQAIVVKRGRPA